MVEISGIRNRSSLEEWLKTQPQRARVAIAARAALRVLPTYWRYSLTLNARNGDLTALPILRCCLILGVAATMPTPEIIEASASAASAASAASSASSSASAASAASAAASAAFASSSSASSAASASASASAASASASRAAFWQAVRVDCSVLIQGEQPMEGPLWPDKNPLADVWSEIRTKILSDDNRPPGDWTFWADWYDQMLDPQTNPPNWPLLERIALIAPKVWDAGPEAVSAEIASLRLNTESAEISSLPSKDAPQTQRPDFQARADRLERDFAELETRLNVVTDHNVDLQDKLSQADTEATSLRAQLKELGAIADSEKTRIEQIERHLEDKLQTELDAAKEASAQANIFRAPQELWQVKEEEHRKAAQWAYGIFIAALLVTIGLLVGVLYGMSQQSDLVTRLLTPSWCDPKVYSEGCTGFSTRGILVGASVFTVFTLMLWFSRLKMKEFLAERHLALDARERRAFMESYTRLLAVGEGQVEGDLSDERKAEIQAEVRAHRAIVYSAVFRPSSDGIVREEGGIDPSIAAAISKLLTR